MPLDNTPILQLETMAENDNQKYLSFNDGIIALEDAANREIVVDFTAGDVTLTESQFLRYAVITASGHSAPRTMIIPDEVGFSPAVPTKRVLMVRNLGTSAGVLTVTHDVAGIEIDVPVDGAGILYCDGTDIVSLGGVSATLPTVSVSEEGTPVETAATDINFAGTGATVTDDADGTVTVTVPGTSISEEGTPVVAAITDINFVGSAVTVTDAGSGSADVTISVPTLPSGSDEGTEILASFSDINFEGAGVTVTDGGGGELTVTIPGASGGSSVSDEGVEVLASPLDLNFVGGGVSVTDGGSGVATITIAGSSAISIQEESVEVLASFGVLDFIGTGVTVTDVAGVATVTIPSFATVTSPADGDVAVYDGGSFVNKPRYYVVGGYAPGTYASSQRLLKHLFTTDADFPTSLTGSLFELDAATTASTTFIIKKNGSSIGTVAFGVAATSSPTVTFASPVSFTSGDNMTIEGPASADATAAGLTLSIRGVAT